MKAKQSLIGIALGASIASLSLTASAATEQQPPGLDGDIMSFAFESNDGFIRELSTTEAEQVKGEVLPFIIGQFAWAGIRAATPHIARYIAAKGGAGALAGITTVGVKDLAGNNATLNDYAVGVVGGGLSGLITGGWGTYGSAVGGAATTTALDEIRANNNSKNDRKVSILGSYPLPAEEAYRHVFGPNAKVPKSKTNDNKRSTTKWPNHNYPGYSRYHLEVPGLTDAFSSGGSLSGFTGYHPVHYN